MIRGTTPEHTFTVDVDLTDAESLFITYKQLDRVIIEKTKGDIEVTAEALKCVLTQHETLALNTKYPVKIQIRAGYEGGSAIASNIITTTVEEILKGGEI